MNKAIKPGVKKSFFAVAGTLFIVSVAQFVSQGFTIGTILLHNTLSFVVLFALMYNVYVRQEFINSKLK